MELIWKASESASALYAATCLAEGHSVADARLAASFAPAVELMLAEFAACGAPADCMLPVLTALAASGVEDNQLLVEQAIAKSRGAGPTDMPVGRLATCIGGLKAAFQTAYRANTTADSPALVDELLLRGRPLVEQWEARGPGMLWQVARSTEEDVIAERANVVLVLPVLGGHGNAHRTVNTVTFEAVLANPIAELPEAVRLAWLLAQLNLDLPKYAEHLTAGRLDSVAGLAMVAPVLAAAEYVELARFSIETLKRALAAWRLVDANATDETLAATAGTLMTWWTTLQEGATPWAVAFAALERMLLD